MNYKSVGMSLYWIKNQNGLKGLIKSMDECDPDGYFNNYKDAVTRKLTQYPESYPAIVSVSDGYHGFHFPLITPVCRDHVTKVLSSLEELF